MDWTQTLFWFFFVMTIGSAVFVVTVRNLVHAAFWLMITLFCVAALYVFLQADFLADTQVVVYVGGILVLVLFGVMMTSGKLDVNLKFHLLRILIIILFPYFKFSSGINFCH